MQFRHAITAHRKGSLEHEFRSGAPSIYFMVLLACMHIYGQRSMINDQPPMMDCSMRREKGGATTATTASYSYETREGYCNSYDYIQVILFPLIWPYYQSLSRRQYSVIVLVQTVLWFYNPSAVSYSMIIVFHIISEYSETAESCSTSEIRFACCWMWVVSQLRSVAACKSQQEWRLIIWWLSLALLVAWPH